MSYIFKQMHVFTIITNFNGDTIWYSTLDRIYTTSLKSTDEGLAWFSNVIIDDLYHNLVT